MLRKILTVALLSFFVLLFMAPRGDCSCLKSASDDQAQAPVLKVGECHQQCCCEAVDTVADDGDTQNAEQKGCCRSLDADSIALGTGQLLVSLYQHQPPAEFINIGFAPRWYPAQQLILSNNFKRGPPGLTGLGTSKTYLFKRVFLL